MNNRRILLNFGRTRAYLDSIRYITNNSSGKMGLALYEELKRRNYQVTTIVGDNDVNFLNYSKRVYTNEEMLVAMEEHYATSDVVICCAALNDYCLKQPFAGKIHKRNHSKLDLTLTPAIDVLKTLGKKKDKQLLVGFSAQDDENDLTYGEKKLKEKNLDLIVINGIQRMGMDRSKVMIYKDEGEPVAVDLSDKKVIASKIIDQIELVLKGRE